VLLVLLPFLDLYFLESELRGLPPHLPQFGGFQDLVLGMSSSLIATIPGGGIVGFCRLRTRWVPLLGVQKRSRTPEQKGRTETTKSAISKRFTSPQKLCPIYTKDEASLL
jgi:hypothetical protein